MSRYIDADLLLENLIETAKGLPEEDRAPYLFCALLIDEEGKHPADVVEVVRCKDCKWSDWYTSADGNRYCYCMETGMGGRTENDYCSYGERGDSDED